MALVVGRLVMAAIAIAAVSTAALGCRSGTAQRSPESVVKSLTPPQAGAKPGTYLVTLYFATPDIRGLAAETRTVEAPGGDKDPEALAKAMAEEVVRGPKARNLYPTLPRSAKLLGATAGADGVLTLDFSRSFQADSPGGEAGERLAVYSIVDAVAAIPGVKAVRFNVEGKPVDTLVGFFDLSEPVKPDLTIIVR
jgi:spore germination protein GerM